MSRQTRVRNQGVEVIRQVTGNWFSWSLGLAHLGYPAMPRAHCHLPPLPLGLVRHILGMPGVDVHRSQKKYFRELDLSCVYLCVFKINK